MPRTRALWQQKPDVEGLKSSGDLDVDFDRIVREGYEALTGEDYYRLKTWGVCSQNQAGVHMMRIRIPGGVASSDQLDRVAELAQRCADGTIHLTTRTNVELHGVPTTKLLEVMESLHQAGLTTRAACGHTVRNVLGCPAAGICAEEVLDTRPWVRETHDAVVRRAAEYNTRLPRRLNVSFGGCGDCARHAQVNDIGFVAVPGPGREPGFAVWIAGSLATTPRVSHALCAYVRAERAVAVMDAVIDVYSEHGFRDNRARLKYLVEAWGIEKFREAFAEAFEAKTGERPLFGEPTMPPEPAAPSDASVLPQRQPGRFRVRVGVPLGDLTPDQVRALASLARDEGDGSVRFSPEQNAEIAWVAEDRIARVLSALSAAGLAAFGAGDVSDVRACPGTTHCVLAVSDSQDAARRIGDVFRSSPPEDDAVRNMRIHISGCPNSCAQHQASDIGLAGCRVKICGSVREGYQLFVGGRLGRRVRMADRIGRIDAAAAEDIVRALVELFVERREDGDGFPDVVERLRPAGVAAYLGERFSESFVPSTTGEGED
ncbi:MAG TPA: nitrite/sulfite reductase [Actinomycetota bacterium]|jgi:sulfite reductase beta subunit-like hemoprotein|nr:nitrite/sulfite reductase [Actinomycetota bacterium]